MIPSTTKHMPTIESGSGSSLAKITPASVTSSGALPRMIG